ncbi:acyl-CoA dehydrogenase family protein [Pseudonocardia kunmingensis]|uniref:Alkylation response protein AidB-like acyl-CoA dehydrogenase n=1 Tax=Pseudonocardia kunmingensis TaxID=630975 RepID=A0A543D0E2_9PSEU|nr:acyl-CoA dehydrogenase family protein [Pseudonocardia kunmingensis]TQM02806.1 alkylation response protein AidB-like acyl-CoA dehydrogenase [Pseudonocardia kunmingensis]
MKFSFDDEQIALAEAVARLLEKECAPEAMRSLWDDPTGRSPALRRGLAGIGLPGILVPEEHGGAAGSLLDLVLVLEEIGKACAPDALLEALVTGPAALALAGSPAQRADWLPAIAAGERRVTLALHTLDSVPDAHVADVLVFADGDGLALAPTAALTLTPLRAVDPARRQFRVEVPAGVAEPLPGGREALPAIAALEASGSAAVLIGLSQRMLDLTVSYAGVRVQFGRAIGSFQGVKHQLAAATVLVRMARLAAHASAWSVATGQPDATAAARAARICALDAEFEANRVALQIHGGIGFTWEHDLGMWLKRGKALEQAHGGRHRLSVQAGRDALARRAS